MSDLELNQEGGVTILSCLFLIFVLITFIFFWFHLVPMWMVSKMISTRPLESLYIALELS